MPIDHTVVMQNHDPAQCRICCRKSHSVSFCLQHLSVFYRGLRCGSPRETCFCTLSWAGTVGQAESPDLAECGINFCR